MNKITKKEIQIFVRNKLASDDLWAKKALLLVYSNQTTEEQFNSETIKDNGIGFSGNHAKFLSSLAKQLKTDLEKIKTVNKKISENEAIRLAYLSTKQLSALKNTIPRYANQVVQASDSNKLVNLIVNS
jgi:hypothetical protein